VRLLNPAQRNNHDHGDERQVDQKDKAPTYFSRKKTTDQWPNRLSDASHAYQCPESDRPLLSTVDGRDDGHSCGKHERSAGAL
jgi:hypothetical protein